ncbi:carboxymuconolactone decarboxylase family protein [Chromobacterium sp. IIBBL 290-4]|uniref:carboxymuconolactone decarboxylase family protein n=1 Tax=Chromobacterium sp. IIBBL 290-4 TaxID=2953890 RepID=UPI0020B64A83|nr:carboxymuconolactone decarboxylase family protein [Chromobacterium sp. IIBBL 290-4]UTH75622.1 carboxymuconolactone decarboxylase family protein [Chromobacterium sp. IIBBL 290-4]
MTTLKMHDLDSAPSGSRALLQSSIDNFGWIPWQSAYMAESPALLSSYQFAHDAFSNCSLSEEERAIVWITTGTINQCAYTVQAHTWIAQHKGVPAATLQALAQEPEALPEKLAALHRFTREVVLAQGQISKEEIAAVRAAGYSSQNVLDVILGVSQKTMSTLLNSIAGTQVEPQFQTTPA